MDGLLLVNKPKGYSSFDVIRKIRSLIKKETGQKAKIGHAGTLDPLAEGLMILLFGKSCKQADKFLKLNKTYEAELTLGATTTTADLEGEISKVSANVPSRNDLRKAISKFVGEIKQTPPAYSAIKIGGERAYKLARKGKKVELPQRIVNVYDLKIEEYKYPILKISTFVSSGTYIRSLAQDIGKQLGTGAYLSFLKRKTIGRYNSEDAIGIENISVDKIKENLQNLP